MEILKNTLIQRKLIGIFTICLVPVCLLFGLFGIKTNPEGWYNAVSCIYFTNAAVIYVFLLSVIGFFMLVYQGYDWRDKVCSIIQGTCLLGMLVFPYEIPVNVAARPNSSVFLISNKATTMIHYICGMSSFICFYINMRFIFTRSSGTMTDEKKKRNMIYKICSWIFLAGAVMFSVQIVINEAHISGVVGVPWFISLSEFIMLTCCGIAWLVKGGTFRSLKDKN